MNRSTVIVVALACLLLAAHLLHGGHVFAALAAAAAPLLMLARRPWIAPVLVMGLSAGLASWVHRTAAIVLTRLDHGLPWVRALVIIAMALAVVAAAIALLVRETRRAPAGPAWPGAAAFAAAALLLVTARLKAAVPVLLADRFVPGAGTLEIVILALYAAWLTDRLADPASSPRRRIRLWTLFSVVFFGQALLGLAGFERLLMTGALHVPVPAVIIGGPLYRGGGAFMAVLFGVTLLFAGPAWCSWFCYFGVWDNRAALAAASPAPPPRHWHWLRGATLALVVAAALGMRAAAVPPVTAATAGLGFGVAGVAIMAILSRRRGVMLHCTAWCPLGLVANLAGRLSPFRVRIGDRCTDCQACVRACRYGALDRERIAQRAPGLTCTLCGDCLAACRHGALAYRFPGLAPHTARLLFIVVVTAFHAAALGLARI